MDPLAIVASVLRTTTTYVSAAKTLNDIQDAWVLAPATVALLCSQLKLNAASLAQLQRLVLENTDALTDKSDIHPAFDTTYTSCLALSTWLKKFMRKLLQDVPDIDGSIWKLEFKTLWSDDEIKEIIDQLQEQRRALDLVMVMLQMHSVLETSQALRTHQDLLQSVAHNTQEFCRSHALETPASVLEAGVNLFSEILGDSSPIQTTFPRRFDTVLLNSKPYSSSMDRVPEDQSEDASDDSADSTIFSNKSRQVSTAADPPVISIPASIPAPVQTAIKDLGVREIYAYTQVYHTANTEEELSFNSRRRITNVQKIDDTWYTGQLKGPTGLGLVGRFHREHVTLKVAVSVPIDVEAKCSFSVPVIGTQTSVTIDKGQKLQVRKLEHDATWTCMEETAPQRRFYVNLELLEIDEAAQQNVDALLDYFRCAQSDLNSDSADELAACVQTKLNETWTDAEYCRVAAHCRSFAELKVLGRVYAEVAESKEEEPE